VVTNFFVIRGAIEAAALGPGRVPGLARLVNILERFSVSGGAPPRIDRFAREQLGQILQGLQASRPQHTQGAGQEQVNAGLVALTVNLITTLLGTSPTGEGVIGSGEASSPPTTTTTTTNEAPLTALTNNPPPTEPPSSGGGGGGGGAGPVGGPLTIDASTFTLSGPLISVVTGATTTIPEMPPLSGGTGAPASIVVVDGTDDPLPVTLAGGIVVTSSTLAGGGQNVFTIAGADVVLQDSVLSLTNSSLTGVDDVISIASSLTGPPSTTTTTEIPYGEGTITVTVTTGVPLVALSGSALSAATLVSVGAGGTLTLAGPVLTLDDATSSATLTGDAVVLAGGALVTSSLPVISVTSTAAAGSFTVSGASSDLLSITGASQVALFGPLLSMAVSASVSGSLVNANGGTFGASTGALAQITGGTLTLGRSLLAAANTTFALVNGARPLDLGAGALTKTDAASPLVSLTASPLVIGGGGGGGGGSALAGVLGFGNATAVTATLAGPMLSATDSPITLDVPIVALGTNTTVTSTTSAALISLLRSPLTIDDNLIRAVASGSALNVRGPVLDATDSPIVVENDFLRFRSLTSTATDPLAPLVRLTRSPFYGKDTWFLRVESGGSLTLTGPLLTATDSVVVLSSDLLTFAGSGTLTMTSTAGTPPPLISLSTSPLLVGDNLLGLCCDGSSSTLSLAGPLLTATDSPLLLNGRPIDMSGSTLTSTTTDPLFTLTRSPLVAGGFFDGSGTLGLAGPFLSATDNPIRINDELAQICCAGTNLTASAVGGTPPAWIMLVRSPLASTTVVDFGGGDLVTFQRALLSATDSPILADRLFRTSVTTLDATNTAPFISLLRSPFANIDDLLVVEGGGTATFAGQLLAADRSPIVIESTGVLVRGNTTLTGSSGTALVSLSWSPYHIYDQEFVRVESGSVVNAAVPLLQAGDSPLFLRGSLVNAAGTVNMTAAGSPLVSLMNGFHSVGIDPFYLGALFSLVGSNSSLIEPLPVEFPGLQVFIGTDRPVRGPAAGPLQDPLLRTSGAGVVTLRGVQLDTALLEVAAPLVSLTADSRVLAQNDFIQLRSLAQLSGTVPAGSGLVTLDASRLVVGGSLVRLGNTSNAFLDLTGNLAWLDNGSRLDVLGGALLAVSATTNQAARLTGAFAAFGATGTNSIRLPTMLAGCGGCAYDYALIPGYAVALASGAAAANVFVDPGFKPFLGLSAANTVTDLGVVLLVEGGAAVGVALYPGGGAGLATSPPAAPGAAGGVVTLTGYQGANRLAIAAPLATVDVDGPSSPTPQAFVAPDAVPPTPYVALAGGSPIALAGGVGLTDSTVVGAGVTVFEVIAEATLTGHALELAGSTLSVVGGKIFSVEAGTFETLGGDALILLDTSGVVADRIVAVGTSGAGTLALAGALLEAVDSTLTAASHAVVVGPGASLTANSTAIPLLSLTRSSLSAGGALFTTDGAVSLGHSLLDATDSTIVTLADLVAVTAGGALTTTHATAPLVKLTDSTLFAQNSLLDAPGLLDLSAAGTQATLAGPVLEATASQVTLRGDLIKVELGATLDANGTAALVSSSGSQLRTLDGVNGALLRVRGTAGLAGPVLVAVDSDAAIRGSLITNFGTLTSTGTAALVQFSRTLPGTNLLSIHDGLFYADNTAGGPAQSLTTLAGPLLAASGTTIVVENEMLSVFDDAILTSTTALPLVSITGGSLMSSGDVLSACCAVTMTLAGPLLEATSTTLVIGEGFMNTCCDTFTLNGSSTLPFISLTDTVTVAEYVLDHCCDTAAINLAGPLLRTTNGSLTLDNGVDLCCGASLASTTGQALLQFTNTTVTVSDTFFSVCCQDSGVFANVSLAGPLLSVNGGSLTVGATLLFVCCSSTFTSTGPDALVSFSSTNVVVAERLVDVCCSPVTLSLAGPVVGAMGSNLTVGESVVNLDNVEMTLTATPGPLVSLTGGTHVLAPGSYGGSSQAIWNLRGSATAVEVVEGNSLTLGTTRPVKGPAGGGGFPVPASLFEASSATIDTGRIVRLDRALLEATAPIVNLVAGTNLAATNEALLLTSGAKLVGNLVPASALIKVDGSTLIVRNGSLVNVVGGSFLNVTGNLLSVLNGGTVSALNGGLVTIAGGSVFSLTGGSLVSFGAGSNTLNLTAAAPLCSGCSLTTAIPNLTGVPVLLKNGASAANVMVNAGFVPFAGLGGSNALNVKGASGAVLVLDGATSKVRLGP
jgi:hypothetical protein